MNTNNVLLFNSLIDPNNHSEPIDIRGFDRGQLLNFLRQMKLIRLAEIKLALGRKDQIIGGPVHLGVGQEAIAVGISSRLRKTDRVFGAHRSHSHVLAMGANIFKLFAEVLGRDAGLSKGMGGSMHLWDQPNGFYGSVPIVSGTVSLAVGAGMAAKIQKTEDIAVSYFGDGAIEEGIVHESLNLAKITNSPVLFVAENNLFASHMHISLRQPNKMLSRFAMANEIPFEIVDGNDVSAMSLAANRLINNARNGQGPGFIEAVTYRWYGHVDWREDIDVGVNRSQLDVIQWKKRDPILRLSNAILRANIFTASEIESLDSELIMIIDEAWQKALNAPYPKDESLMSRVYAN
jgi:pyruvate dehydrogenase E1 component alpha subunit